MDRCCAGPRVLETGDRRRSSQRNFTDENVIRKSITSESEVFSMEKKRSVGAAAAVGLTPLLYVIWL